MANVRINPNDHLKETAKELALYLSVVPHTELNKIINQFEKEYEKTDYSRVIFLLQPLFYFSGNHKNKKNLPEIEALLKGYGNQASENKEGIQIVEKIIDILFKDDKWDEGSYNTKLMRQLVKQLHGYDHECRVPAEVCRRLKELLIEALKNKLECHKKREKLDELEQQIKDKNDELIKTLAELDTLKKNIMEKNQDMTFKQAAIQEKELELSKIEKEKNEKRTELQTIKNTLSALDPDVDITTLDEKQLADLKKYIKMAVFTYVKEIKEQAKKREELNMLCNKTDEKKVNSTMHLIKLSDEQKIKQAEKYAHEKELEMKKIIEERKKLPDNPEFKNKLQSIFNFKTPRTTSGSISENRNLERKISFYKNGGAHVIDKPEEIKIISEDYCGKNNKNFLSTLEAMNTLFKPRMCPLEAEQDKRLIGNVEPK